MKLQALAALCSIALVNAHGLSGDHAKPFGKHAHIARQATSTSTPPAGSTFAAAAPPAAPTGGSLGYDPNGIPPLSDITSGMPTGTTYAVSSTFTPGTKPTAVPNAPPIPQCESL